MIGKVGAIVAMQAERVHQEQEKTLDAVLSGMARVAVPFACFAGPGSAGRTGTPLVAIDTVGRRGGEFPLGKRGSPLIRPDGIEGLTTHAVISGMARMAVPFT